MHFVVFKHLWGQFNKVYSIFLLNRYIKRAISFLALPCPSLLSVNEMPALQCKISNKVRGFEPHVGQKGVGLDDPFSPYNF